MSEGRGGSVLSLASLTKLLLTRRRVWGGQTVLTSDVISLVYFVFQRPFCASLPCIVFWIFRSFLCSGSPLVITLWVLWPYYVQVDWKSRWSFNIRFSKSHKRRRAVRVWRRRRAAAIVLSSALPNHPLFFLWPVCVQMLFEQTGHSQEAGKRAAKELAGS